MLTSAKRLKDYRIAAIDGEVGKVRDCLFDDRTWVIRYVTTDTGSWLESHPVRISPDDLGEINETHKTLPVHITQDKLAVPADEPGLRSCETVEGYHIQSLDGEIGSVSDFLIDRDSWAIRYLVVSTGHWWSGNQVLIPPQWATGVHWTEETVSFNLSRDVIKAAPPFTSCEELNQQLELDFHRHYDRPTYWDRGDRGI